MKLLKEKFPIIFAGFILLLIIVAIKKTALFLDPDFGWHIRTGQYILQHGIPRGDPFSYTMPSFQYIADSWLIESLFALLLPHIGYEGLAVILACVSILSLVVVLIPHQPFRNMSSIIPLSLGFSVLLPYLSVRAQTFSWLFFAIFMLIIFEKRYWSRFKWALPLLMLVWVNIHGSFAVGAGVLSLVVLFKLLMRQVVPRTDIVIVALTLLVTLVNPYGVELWNTVFLTFTSDKLRTQVSEWGPLFLRLSYFHIPLMALSLVLVIKLYASLNKALVFIFFLLLFFGMTSSKLFPFWIVTAVYIVFKSLAIFEKKLAIDKVASGRLKLFFYVVIFFSIVILLLQIPRTFSAYSRYKESTYYPTGAVRFIHENDVPDNIFAAFGWGGYLQWKLPEYKVFVDGRMPYWKQLPTSPRESSDAFHEYSQIIHGELDLDVVFTKYNVKTVLLPKRDAFAALNEFRLRLKKLEWPVLYEDDVSIIYARKELPRSEQSRDMQP